MMTDTRQSHRHSRTAEKIQTVDTVNDMTTPVERVGMVFPIAPPIFMATVPINLLTPLTTRARMMEDLEPGHSDVWKGSMQSLLRRSQSLAGHVETSTWSQLNAGKGGRKKKKKEKKKKAQARLSGSCNARQPGDCKSKKREAIRRLQCETARRLQVQERETIRQLQCETARQWKKEMLKQDGQAAAIRDSQATTEAGIDGQAAASRSQATVGA